MLMQADTDRSLAMIDTQWGTPPYFTASAAGRYWCNFAHIAATGTPFPENLFWLGFLPIADADVVLLRGALPVRPSPAV